MVKSAKAKLNLVLIMALLFSDALLFSQTTIQGSFLHDGLVRSYRAYIPASYAPSQAVPLLFNLHGYGSNALEQELYGDFRPIADTANFIIVHPNGSVAAGTTQFWNTFGGATVDDVGFLSRLIDTMARRYSIDLNRVYSTGMSNGGFMSYDLACLLSHRIAAVASVTGSMIWPRLSTCNPTHPTPAMQIHGTADATVLYNGNLLFAPIDTVVRYWVRKNNCNPIPIIVPVPNINANDGCTADRFIFHGGTSASSVEFYKVYGGGHSWPGAPININITCMDFSASTVIWSFFRKYRLNQLVAATPNPAQPFSDHSIYPNPTTDWVTVSFNGKTKRSYSLFNYCGQVIGSGEVDNQQLIFNLPLPGIYLLTIRQDNLIKTEKIIRF